MTDVNYNTGFATAVGFGVAFVCAMAQMAFKRTVNRAGVIDSNSAIFQFLIPSFFAAIFCAVGQGIGKGAGTYPTVSQTGAAVGTAVYANLNKSGRSF